MKYLTEIKGKRILTAEGRDRISKRLRRKSAQQKLRQPVEVLPSIKAER